MILPRGNRWWLVLQRQLSFHFSSVPISPYISCSLVSILYFQPTMFSCLLIKTQNTDMHWHTERGIYSLYIYIYIYTVHVHTHTGRHSFLVRLRLGVQQSQSHLSGVLVCVCVCVCACVHKCMCACMCECLSTGGGVRPVLVASGASDYCPSVTSNYSFGRLTHTAALCVCVCRCLSLTSSCVVLTWRATSIRLWFARPVFFLSHPLLQYRQYLRISHLISPFWSLTDIRCIFLMHLFIVQTLNIEIDIPGNI